MISARWFLHLNLWGSSSPCNIRFTKADSDILWDDCTWISMHSLLLLSFSLVHLVLCGASAVCRNKPGDAGFPSQAEWSTLNTSVSGRLVSVIPSAKYCEINKCTDDQWQSGLFRMDHIPGAMNQVSSTPSRLDHLYFLLTKGV
jgi:hypothetical protein